MTQDEEKNLLSSQKSTHMTLILFIKMNSERVMNLKVKVKAVQILEEKGKISSLLWVKYRVLRLTTENYTQKERH